MTLNRHGIHQFPKAHNILNMLYFLHIIKVQIQRKKNIYHAQKTNDPTSNSLPVSCL